MMLTLGFLLLQNYVCCPVCQMADYAWRDRKHSRQFDVTISLLPSKINIYGMCSKNLNRNEFLSIAAQLFSQWCIVYCDKEKMNAVVSIWGFFFWMDGHPNCWCNTFNEQSNVFQLLLICLVSCEFKFYMLRS